MTRRRYRLDPLPFAAVGSVLLAWQALTVSAVLPPEVPSITRIAHWLGGQVSSTALWTPVGQTLLHWAAGLAIGTTVGAVVGVLMASRRLLRHLLLGTVEFLRPIPVVVYLPIMLLLMGTRPQVAIILVAIAATWPVLVQTMYGVAALDPIMRDTAQVFGLRGSAQLRWVVVPTVLPYFATGLRISSTIALLAAVAIELVGAVPGLGSTLNAYAANGVYPAVYGIVVVTGLLGVVINAAFESCEARLLRWHPSQRRRVR